ncbi:MAG TPA: FMN-binding protein [Bryobacteraceae bacterium]|nr:FMN-binding protein [Bryobacteraceae bacterium]
MPPASSPNKANKKVANSLVALSSAAVLAVYSAGYVRTKAAAEKFVQQADDRRPRQAPPARPEIVEASLKTAPAPVPVEAKAEPKPEEAREKPKAVEKAPSADAAPAPAPAAAPVVAAAPAAAAAPMSPPPPWKDGIWKGWGTCRHGDIQAAVKIENGKITQAGVSDCETRYSCDIIDKLPPEVLQRQTADVDRVGGATQSSDAFYYAVYEALRQAAEAYKADAAGAPAAAPAAPPQAN